MSTFWDELNQATNEVRNHKLRLKITGKTYTDVLEIPYEGGIIFEECVFDHCNLSRRVFDKCIFLNCRFENCHMYKTNFVTCNFTYREGPTRYYDNILSIIQNVNDVNDVNVFNSCDMLGTRFLDSALSYVNFTGKNMWNDCAFIYTVIEHCNFTDQDLKDANWVYPEFQQQDFSKAASEPNIPLVCPETGSFIAYKKVITGKAAPPNFKYFFNPGVQVIAKLEIPESAMRSSGAYRKCRASKAKVLEFQDLEGNHLDIGACHSIFDHSFGYELGKEVEVSRFNRNRWNECSEGIHFFMSRDEAVEYRF